MLITLPVVTSDKIKNTIFLHLATVSCAFITQGKDPKDMKWQL